MEKNETMKDHQSI